MELNQIQSSALNWGEAASSLNQNFQKINTEVEKVKNATTRNKGYFSMGDELTSAYPTANIGDIAYVKSDTLTPYERWEWTSDGWTASGVAGGNDDVELGNYYTTSEVDEKFTETDAKLSELDDKVGEDISRLNHVISKVIANPTSITYASSHVVYDGKIGEYFTFFVKDEERKLTGKVSVLCRNEDDTQSVRLATIAPNSYLTVRLEQNISSFFIYTEDIDENIDADIEFIIKKGKIYENLEVKFAEQYLTDEQKQTARRNIGLGNGEFDEVATRFSDNLMRSDAVFNELYNFKYSPISNDSLDFIDGYIEYGGGIGSSSQYKVYYLHVNAGERYKISGKGMDTVSYAWGIYTSESFGKDTVVRMSPVISDVYEYVIDIKEGENILAFTWHSRTKSKLEIGTPIYKFLNQQRQEAETPFKVEIPVNLSCDEFDIQERCVHHDNFHRVVEGWNIQSNDPTGEAMNYTTLDNDKNEDDGFRIIDNVLVNNKDSVLSEGFRGIADSIKLFGSVVVETDYPRENTRKEFFFNYVDSLNYSVWYISNIDGIIKVYFGTYSNGVLKINSELDHVYAGQAIKCMFSSHKVFVYVDNTNIFDRQTPYIQRTMTNIVFDVSKPLGLKVSKDYDYEYRFVNIYDLKDKYTILEENRLMVDSSGKMLDFAPANHFDYSYQHRENIIVVGMYDEEPDVSDFEARDLYVNTTTGMIHRSFNNVWEDGYLPEANSLIYNCSDRSIYIYDGEQYVHQSVSELFVCPFIYEVFELRKEDVTNTDNTRAELYEKRFLRTNLKKRKISFDVLIPKGYVADNTEAYFQAQVANDNNFTRVPPLAIGITKTVNGAVWDVSHRSIKTKGVEGEVLERHDAHDIGKVEFGTWVHWEIFYKEGYMQEHNPYLEIKRDGIVVYRSYLPNIYNNVEGSYARFGVYKSMYNSNPEACISERRIAYFANIRIES